MTSNYPTDSGTSALSAVENPAPATASAAVEPLTVIPDAGAGPKQRNAVFVNVYDVFEGNSWLWSVGLGVHHVGLQVYDREYMYGRCEEGTGIDMVEPRHAPPHIFREQFYIGQTNLSESAVGALAESFRQDGNWQGRKYHLIKHNCIDFAHALSKALLSPEVRVAQLRTEDDTIYRSAYTETVEVEGRQYTVPVLIPPHVDRLCRCAMNYLPDVALEKLDNIDNPFPAS